MKEVSVRNPGEYYSYFLMLYFYHTTLTFLEDLFYK